MTRRAFTLIELTMVLLIIAIAAAAVAIRAQGALRGTRLRDVVGGIVDYDRTTRAAARRQDRPLRLVVDLTEGRISRADDAGRRLEGTTFSLPPSVRISRLLCGAQESGEGEVTISISRKGLTPTYALRLQSAEQGEWLVMAGLSGEYLKVDGDDEVRNILAAAPSGNDAH